MVCVDATVPEVAHEQLAAELTEAGRRKRSGPRVR